MLSFKEITAQYKTVCQNCGHSIKVGEQMVFVPQGKWKICGKCAGIK